MLWRAWFQNGFLMGAWFNNKVPFLDTSVIYLSYCRFQRIFLKHSCENVFFSKLYVGWERGEKECFKNSFLFAALSWLLNRLTFYNFTLWRPNLKVVGNLSTLVYRQGKVKNFINFKILYLTWTQKEGLLKLSATKTCW